MTINKQSDNSLPNADQESISPENEYDDLQNDLFELDQDLDNVAPTATSPGAKIAVITSEKPPQLSKLIKLNKEGALEKVAGGNLIKGKYEIVDAKDPESFVETLRGLGPSQATTYGLPVKEGEKGEIVCKNMERNGELTRTRKNFAYPAGPAWMMFDIDFPGLSMDEIKLHFKKAVPDFENIPAVFGHSTSSFIYNQDKCLIGEGGKRVYILVNDGQDIPRAAKGIAGRLKINGTLYYEVSKVGHLLERCLIDEAVYQPERLDFSGRCRRVHPLIQKRPAPVIQNNDAVPLDTKTAIPDLTRDDKEVMEKMREIERAKVKDQVIEIRGKWIEKRVKEQEEKAGQELSAEEKERLRREFQETSQNKVLSEDFILYPEDGGEVKVRELFNDPDNWHGARFADPLEPNYQNDKRIATANLQGKKPEIWSFAHGGQRFMLKKETYTLNYKAGRLPELVDHCTEVLHKNNSVYQRGDELVRVAGDKIYPVGEAWLRNRLEKNVTFVTVEKRAKGPKEVIKNCPAEVPRRILANVGEWPFDELRSLVNLPIMRQDGTILSKPGYDPATGLILLRNGYDQMWSQIPEEPTIEQIMEALGRIWQPFSFFPFKSPVDVGVLLAMVFTIPTRPILHTAPACLIEASMFGSGKTYLAIALSAMAGKPPTVSAWPDTQAEQRKSLVSLLTRSPGTVIFDNLIKTWKSPDLAAILTGDTFSDRILGVSQMIDVNTSSVFIGTGNNVALGDDLARRALVCKIDPGVERPDKRSFPFKPKEVVEKNVASLRADVLTVLRGFVNAGRPRITEDSLGSFEDWDEIVRQAVCWIAKNRFFPVEIGDPVESINENYAADPSTNKLRAFMVNWYNQFGEEPVTAAEAIHHAEIQRQADLIDGDEPSGFAASIYEVAGRGSTIVSNILGNWLGRNKERIVDGFKILRATMKDGNQRWKVIKAEEVDQVDLSGPFPDTAENEIKNNIYSSSHHPEEAHLVHLGASTNGSDTETTSRDATTDDDLGFSL